MRIRWFLLFMLTLSVCYAGVNVGVIGGLNVSSLQSVPQGSLTMSNDNKLGFGAVIEYLAEDNFSLDLGMLLLNKGANFTIESQDDITAVSDLRYFSLPLTLHYHFHLNRLRPYLLGGAFGEYRLSSSRTYHTPAGDVNVDMTEQIDCYNYGYLLGAGVNWDFGKNILYLETRYSIGRRDIDINNDAWSLKTRGVQTYFGLKHTIF